ncbi:MAG: hypothetical protein ACYC6O_10990 [Thermoleophilia bacterium]
MARYSRRRTEYKTDLWESALRQNMVLFTLIGFALFTLSGCGDSTADIPQSAENLAPPQTSVRTSNTKESEPCSLLTKDEVASVVGQVKEPRTSSLDGNTVIDSCQFDSVEEREDSFRPKFTVVVSIIRKSAASSNMKFTSEIPNLGDAACKVSSGQCGFTGNIVTGVKVRVDDKVISVGVGKAGDEYGLNGLPGMEDQAMQLAKIAAENL